MVCDHARAPPSKSSYAEERVIWWLALIAAVMTRGIFSRAGVILRQPVSSGERALWLHRQRNFTLRPLPFRNE